MTVKMISTLEEYEDRAYSGPIPFCPFCDCHVSFEQLPAVKVECDSATFIVHKNCAAAFGAQIVNEIENLLTNT